MPERLVDVLNGMGTVIHTFPIMIDGADGPSDEDCLTSPLKLAAHAHLVPDGDVETLTARVHVAGVDLGSVGDDSHILEGTIQGLEKVVRERALFIWQQDGHSHQRAEEHWYRAFDQHLRERAYFFGSRNAVPKDELTTTGVRAANSRPTLLKLPRSSGLQT